MRGDMTFDFSEKRPFRPWGKVTGVAAICRSVRTSAALAFTAGVQAARPRPANWRGDDPSAEAGNQRTPFRDGFLDGRK